MMVAQTLKMLSRLQQSEQVREAVRFFLVALVGLGFDIAVAWALIKLAGVSDLIAATTGFAMATVLNYFAHQVWTFRAGSREVASRRFFGFTVVVLLALAVRLLVLNTLGNLLPGAGMEVPVRLGLAAGTSFVVAFTLSRLLVFPSRQSTGKARGLFRNGDEPVGLTRLRRLGLAAGFVVVYAAVIETSTRNLLFNRLLGEPLPLLPVFVGGVALLIPLLLSHDRRHPFMGLWLGRGGALPSQVAPWLDTALAIGCLVVVLAILNGFSSQIDLPIVDGFHDGEILAGVPVVETQGTIPLLIHGPGRNILPGALAAFFAEPGYVASFTRFVESAERTLTALMIVGVTMIASTSLLAGTAPPPERRALTAAAGLSALLFAWGYAAVSSRHLLFLIALALTVWMVRRAGRTDGRAATPAFALGAVVAVSPLYVYSAAVETGLVVAAGGAIVLLRHRFSARWTVGAGVLGLALCTGLVLALGGGALYEIATRDILFWVGEGRGIWALPTSRSARVLFGVTFTIALCALVIALAWRASRAATRAMRSHGAVYWVLAVALIAASRNVMERSEWPHLAFAFTTVSVVIGTLGALAFRTFLARWPTQSRIALACLMVVAFGISASGVGGLSIRDSLAALRIHDSQLLPVEVVDLVEHYEGRLSTQDCLLVLTNEGTINYVAGLPPCGGVFYPVYWSTPSGDTRLAAWLEAHPQSIVVSETNFWSDKIDGRSMAERLPKTFALIERTMPLEETIGGRVVRLAPLTP